MTLAPNRPARRSEAHRPAGALPEPAGRFARQQALVPRSRLEQIQVSVIGLGAIGRQVALQLAALGTRRLRLIDFDHVEPANLTTQGYRTAELGRPKVQAAAQAIGELDPAIQVECIPRRYRPALGSSEAVFCCVDSIAAREAIWRSAGRRARFFADGRMLGEVIRILVVADNLHREYYPQTLFAPGEAQPGPCTAQGTIYTAGIAAGLLVHQFTRWLRGLRVDRETIVNLLAGEWQVE